MSRKAKIFLGASVLLVLTLLGAANFTLCNAPPGSGLTPPGGDAPSTARAGSSRCLF